MSRTWCLLFLLLSGLSYAAEEPDVKTPDEMTAEQTQGQSTEQAQKDESDLNDKEITKAEEETPQEPEIPPVDLSPEAKALKKAILTTEKRTAKLEKNWANTTSEMSRDIMQQQAVAETLALSQRVIDFVGQVNSVDTDEAKALGEEILNAENQFFEARLKLASSSLQKLFEQYENAQLEDQILILLNIDDFYAYTNWLLRHRQDNLNQLSAWQVNITDEQARLNDEITRYADFMAIYLRSTSRQKAMLQEEINTLPVDARSALESKLVTEDRLASSAVENLKQVISLMNEQNLQVDQYNELIFKSTGNIAEAVVSWGTLQAVFISFWHDGINWAKANVGNLISRLVLLAGLVGITVFLSRLIRKIIARAVTHKKAQLSTLVQDFFITVGGNLVVIFGVLFALAQVGWDLTPLLTGLGVAGIVIGFALQDTLSNFASGLMILIYRPFDVGDYVQAGGVEGKVGKMSLVNTTIRTFDNQVFMVPNAKIWGQTIKNITSERLRRVDMVFGVAYSDNIEQVEALLAQVISEDSRVLKSPEPTIKLNVLGESSVDFIVRPWVRTDDYWDVYWDITREVKVRFDQEGITIPFPQRELHVNQLPQSKA